MKTAIQGFLQILVLVRPFFSLVKRLAQRDGVST
jgi:hypothetical protein